MVVVDTVRLSICCEGELTSGRECDWSTELVVSEKLWDEGFTCWCPKCGTEISDGWGIGPVDG